MSIIYLAVIYETRQHNYPSLREIIFRLDLIKNMILVS